MAASVAVHIVTAGDTSVVLTHSMLLAVCVTVWSHVMAASRLRQPQPRLPLRISCY